MAIYILSDPFAARLKIGYTNNLQKRIKTHLSSNPGLVVLATMEMGDRGVERALHRLLQGHRVGMPLCGFLGVMGRGRVGGEVGVLTIGRYQFVKQYQKLIRQRLDLF